MREFLRGNKAYQKYFVGLDLVTCRLNLIELYYLLLRDDGEKSADRAFLGFKQYETSVTDDDVRNAMKFRLASKAKRLDISYADAIGYTIAHRLAATFLTGDDAFAEMSHVEFVK